MRLRVQGTKKDSRVQGVTQAVTRSINYPGVADGVLFDFDPAKSTTEDVIRGISASQVGTGFSLETARGNVCTVFDGAGALVFDGAPFSALSDLTGGVSIYAVCERTDVSASADGVVHIDDASAGSGEHVLASNWNGNDTLSVLSYEASGAKFDTGSPLVRNQVSVLSGHITTTSIDAKIDGAGSPTAIAATDPSGLDRVVIGNQSIATDPGSSTAGLQGRIYRVLICEGAYDADVLAYLQGLYGQGAPRIPAGVSQDDVLAIYDPEWSRRNEWAGDQTLAETGTVTFAWRNGSLAAEFGGGGNDYLSGTPPFTDFSGRLPVTLYQVGEADASGAAGAQMFSIQDTTYDAESLSNVLRVGIGNLALVYDASAVAQSNTTSLGVAGRIHQATTELTNSTLSTWLDGTAGSATATSGKTPSSLDAIHVGDIPGSTRIAGKVHYAIMVAGERSAEVETWLASEFPVGETP